MIRTVKGFGIVNKAEVVYLGCYNKISQTGWLINNIYSHSPEGWKSEIRVPAWLGLGPLLVVDFLLCPHMVEGASELFYEVTNPFHEGSTLMP